MPALILNMTIPAGQSLSNAVDLGAGILLRIRMPMQWTPANISFQMAVVDAPENYRDVWSLNGEVIIAVPPNKNVALVGDIVSWAKEGFLKIRSGTSDNPIPQQAARMFELVVNK
jgi:hypothetical protein